MFFLWLTYNYVGDNVFKKILILFLIILSVNVVIHADNGLMIQASSYILMEKESKRVLSEKNMNERYLTASIAKIMTAIVTIENCDNLEKYVEVGLDTIRQEGSSIYLKEGDKVKIIDLLYGLLLRSGNDAAYLLAKTVGSSIDNFAILMNQMAKKVGMISSTFNNPSGLDSESFNYSTAYDMALLMAYALNNKIFAKITSTKSYSSKTYLGNTLYFVNKHKLVHNLDYVTGGKTGYTKNAKRTLVTSAKKNGMELIVVTFNCGDDWNAHQKLFDYGFNNFKMKTILRKQIIDLNNQYYDVIPFLPQDLRYPLKDNEKVKCIVYLINNPKDKIIGKASLYINNKEATSIEIYRYY